MRPRSAALAAVLALACAAGADPAPAYQRAAQGIAAPMGATALAVTPEPVIVEARNRRRSRERRARNAAIAAVILMDGEHAKCVAEYTIHYGAQVEELCARDLMNADSIPWEVREQWRQWRLGQ